MYFTKNEEIQKTSYILARTITKKRVHDLSVAVEMHTEDSQPIYLGDPLVKGLQHLLNDSYHFGYLLFWLSLLDHFVDVVSKTYY